MGSRDAPTAAPDSGGRGDYHMIQDGSSSTGWDATLVGGAIVTDTAGGAKRGSGASERRSSSWTEVEKAILLRIVSGVYEPGQQLPSTLSTRSLRRPLSRMNAAPWRRYIR